MNFLRLSVELLCLSVALKKPVNVEVKAENAAKRKDGYLASRVREHFSDKGNRYNKLPVRLIGKQAIQLARSSYRLADTSKCNNETEAQKNPTTGS